MIIFNLMSIQFMADDNTINWKEHTITLRHNIKLIHITITHYPEQTYKIMKPDEIVYNWNNFLEYWNKNILEYNKDFNIEFDKLILGVDYSLAPIYINYNMNNNTNNIYIGIYIFNNNIIKKIPKTVCKDYSFLSSIEPYLLSKTDNNNNNNNNNTSKYNFMYGILNKDKSTNNTNTNFKNKEFNLDTKINIPLKYILQNSMNYLPKLNINIIKMSSRNPLNP